jgi:tripartite-type tricarboxylate transporter receptor subunit TctC
MSTHQSHYPETTMTQARRKIHPQPLNRRQAIVVIATTLAVGRIGAQALTGKPIVIKVAYPTGGPADVAIRKLQQQLQSGLATPIVIENQPGATGWIAARAVLQTPPDGQTLLVTTGNDLILAPLTLASAIYKPTSFRLVATIAPTDMVLVTSDAHSLANVAALVNASKVGQPLTAGTWGPGSFSHLVTGDFKQSHGREDRRHPLQGCPTDQPSIRSTTACLAVSSWAALLASFWTRRAGHGDDCRQTGLSRFRGLASANLWAAAVAAE